MPNFLIFHDTPYHILIHPKYDQPECPVPRIAQTKVTMFLFSLTKDYPPSILSRCDQKATVDGGGNGNMCCSAWSRLV